MSQAEKPESLHRRFLLKMLGAAGLGAATSAVTAACESEPTGATDDNLTGVETFEYIIAGSGAGGGPLACNLARNGHKVLLLEAGDDQGARIEYQVPAFHGQSTEVDAMRWDFFVKHYDDDTPQKKEQQTGGRQRCFVPAGRHTGRLHGAQRHDHGAAA